MKSVGIIGNGFVGSAIVSGFSLHADVKIYDAKPELATHTLSEVVNESQYVFIGVPTPMKTVTGGEIVLDIMDSVFRDIAAVPKHDSFSYDNVIFIIKSRKNIIFTNLTIAII